MCGGISSGKRDAAAELANILNTVITDSTYSWAVLPSSLRELIRNRWDEICRLAHQIHDEETSEKAKLQESVNKIVNLSREDFLDIVRGNASKQTIDLVKFYAKKVLEIK